MDLSTFIISGFFLFKVISNYAQRERLSFQINFPFFSHSRLNMLPNLARGKVCSSRGGFRVALENGASANGIIENIVHFEVIEIEVDRFISPLHFFASSVSLQSTSKQQSTMLIDNASLIDSPFLFREHFFP